MGPGVAGTHGWLDRRITKRGSKFQQSTVGLEWLAKTVDFRVNGYIPLSDEQSHAIANQNPQAPTLSGTGIIVDTNATVLEEPQYGFDAEFGLELGNYSDAVANYTDSLRVYGGGYFFEGDYTENVAGWRTRIAADVTEDFQIGARFQRDDERGSQGFLEATLRFPFGQKKSYRREGLRARLDESPERDIDIVTSDVITDTGSRVQVLNAETGQPQEVLIVDNTAASGGDGSVESPFDTLTDAQNNANDYTIIYVKYGNGSDVTGDSGIILDHKGQQLIGSGTDFVYDSGRFSTANGGTPTSIVIAPATTAPVVSNSSGRGIDITADDVTVAGMDVDTTSGIGIYAYNVDNAKILNNSVEDAGSIGIYYYADDGQDHGSIYIEGNTVDTVSSNGISVLFQNGESAELVSMQDNVVINQSTVAVRFAAAYGADVERVIVADNVVQDSNNRGYLAWINNGSHVGTLIYDGNSIDQSAREGFFVTATQDSSLDNLYVTDNVSTNGDEDGLVININGSAEIKRVYLDGNDFSGNGLYGMEIIDTSSNDFGTIDAGGGSLGSSGGNIIFGNTNEEIYLDMDGKTLSAQHNWWGSASGLDEDNEVDFQDGSKIDASNPLTQSP